ncbi:MAG: acetyl-coenzyme A synthetase N-terminal domain-containing protein, partial [Candidatus Krumholzibacteriota bacterium]
MDSGTGEILWTPAPGRIDAALVTRFRRDVNQRLGLDLADYAALHGWSVDDRPAFWRALWEFAGVVGDGPGRPAVIDGDRMPGARWFPEARLNYAENLLQGSDEAEAIVFLGEERGESGDTRRLDYAELRRAVARVADGLAADGVGPGDRVAGFLPN